MREFTEEENYRLVALVEVLIKIDQEEKARQKRLEKEPEGFAIDGMGRTCGMCNRYMMEEAWYDVSGFKCMRCKGKLAICK